MSMNTIGGPACSGDKELDKWDNDLHWFTVAIPCDVFLQDIVASESFCLENAVLSSYGRSVPLVGQPLAPGLEDRLSPPLSLSTSDPVFAQHPCPETGFSELLPCNADIADGRYRIISGAQDFLGHPFTYGNDAGLVDPPSSNPITVQEADVYTPRYISPASGTSSATNAHMSERVLLTGSASPNSAQVNSQPKPYPRDLRPSRDSDSSEQITCGLCRSTFTQLKDLKRHNSSIHPQPDDPVYRCRCNKGDPRKDNHVRHIRRCAKEPEIPSSYACKCSHPSENQHHHLEHVKSCSYCHGSRGRPRTS